MSRAGRRARLVERIEAAGGTLVEDGVVTSDGVFRPLRPIADTPDAELEAIESQASGLEQEALLRAFAELEEVPEDWGCNCRRDADGLLVEMCKAHGEESYAREWRVRQVIDAELDAVLHDMFRHKTYIDRPTGHLANFAVSRK